MVNLACVPIFLRVLGVSGYGLIGIWGLLETFANLLDLGLSPTMIREMARSFVANRGSDRIRDLVRTLEVGYWSIGILIGATIAFAAPLIAPHWLRGGTISPQVCLRDHAGRTADCLPMANEFLWGGLSGIERQVLLSWVSFFFLCARNLGAIAVIIWISPAITDFFSVASSDQSHANRGLRCCSSGIACPAGPRPVFRLILVRQIRRFAAGLTAVTLVSMILTELDKLVISKQLSLETFGYYSLGWSIAASLSLVSAPVFSALFPGFCPLRAAAGATEELAASLS